MLYHFTFITACSVPTQFIATWLISNATVCPDCLEKISKRVNLTGIIARPWRTDTVDPNRYFDDFERKEGIMLFLDSNYDKPDYCDGCGKKGNNSWKEWSISTRVGAVIDKLLNHLTRIKLYNEIRLTKSMIETTKIMLSAER